MVSLFPVSALVFLCPELCHWFSWAKLWNCPSAGRTTGEPDSEPQGMDTGLVAAQCVANRINAHLNFTGTDASPRRDCLEHSRSRGYLILEIVAGARDGAEKVGWAKSKVAKQLKPLKILLHFITGRSETGCVNKGTQMILTPKIVFRRNPFAFFFGIFGEEGLELMPAMHKAASVLQQHCSL